MFETAEAVLMRLYSEGRPMWTVRENESRGRVVGAWPSGSILRHFCHTEAEVEIIAARQGLQERGCGVIPADAVLSDQMRTVNVGSSI